MNEYYWSLIFIVFVVGIIVYVGTLLLDEMYLAQIECMERYGKNCSTIAEADKP